MVRLTGLPPAPAVLSMCSSLILGLVPRWAMLYYHNFISVLLFLSALGCYFFFKSLNYVSTQINTVSLIAGLLSGLSPALPRESHAQRNS